MKLKHILIAIQARSTSTRLPGKVHALIEDKRLLDHVIDACDNAASHVNKRIHKDDVVARVCLCVPKGDEIVEKFKSRSLIVEGPEEDVLTRYQIAAEEFKADFIVRVTSDCGLLPGHVIAKHIIVAVKNNYDFVSNCEEDIRTTFDGMDVEVMSNGLLNWLHLTAETKHDREHVTTLAKRDFPKWARTGAILSEIDFSDLKLSVDTKEDLELVRKKKASFSHKFKKALDRHGKGHVHIY